MAKVIDVPGVGTVEFPDTMGDDQISSVLRKQAMARIAPPEQAQPQGSAVGRFLKGAYDTGVPGVLQAVGAVGQGILHNYGPMKDLVNGAIQGQTDQFGKAVGSAQKGEMLQAAGHALAGMVPLVGPAAANAADTIGGTAPTYNKYGAILDPGKAPDIASGLGQTAALLAPSALKVIPRPSRISVVPKMTNPNPSVASAVRFGLGNDIPVDAGTATGNFAVKGIQHLADRSIGGSLISTKAAQSAADAFTRVGEKLAEKVYPNPVVPEQAGAGIRSAIQKEIVRHDAAGDSAYGNFRQIEADPKNLQTVQVGTKLEPPSNTLLDAQGNPIGQSRVVPITKQIPLPVDVRPIKTLLQPIADRMSQWMEPAARNASKGYTAIQSILKGDDFIPASVAEEGLSGLKTLAREADSPQTRNVSQGLGAYAAKNLQSAIDGAVAKAGPDALQSLQDGRAATVSKYGAKAVLDQLREEPVQTFNQTTWQKDAGIENLRQVEKLAPSEMPKLGRAFLDDLFSKATAEGGFDKTGSIFEKWDKLGPETKKILYPDKKTVSDLDNFFLLAKKMGESPNPSGTAHVAALGAQGALLITHPHIGVPLQIGGAALAKMLHSPVGIKALTEGLKIPTWKTPQAISAARQIISLAGNSNAQKQQIPQSTAVPLQ